MEITPLASDVNKHVQANVGIQSSFRSTHDFSRHLKTGTEDMGFALQIPEDMDVSELDTIAREEWGTAYDPLTHTVKLDQLAQNTQHKTEIFARKLGGLLRNENIETDYPISLSVSRNGAIVIGANHPQKAQIEQYFDENPSLAAEYRLISNDNDTVAMGKLAAEYGQRWTAAQTKGQKQSVFSHFSSIFKHSRELNGKMTLSMDILTSASLLYSNKVTKS